MRLDFLIPARGLIGFRTEFLTETRGTGILHSVFERYEPWQGEIRTRPTTAGGGSPRAHGHLRLPSSRSAGSCSSARARRSTREWSSARTRSDDLDVNAVREKKLTNMRAAGSDETVKLVPHHQLSLDQALEFIRDDECVEVTPDAVRLRKLVLDPVERQKAARARKRG